jgi:hypothetical protein
MNSNNSQGTVSSLIQSTHSLPLLLVPAAFCSRPARAPTVLWWVIAAGVVMDDEAWLCGGDWNASAWYNDAVLVGVGGGPRCPAAAGISFSGAHTEGGRLCVGLSLLPW